MQRKYLGVLAMALCALTCTAGENPHRAGAAERIRWRVVDSSWVSPWDEMNDSMPVYRIAVTSPSGVDTVRDVMAPWPLVTDDSTVWGLRGDRMNHERRLFRLRTEGHQLSSW